ncbi:hypothetical protein H1P_1940003 [Hyella patelloides LEGE 07179]|uniref:Uncharacterized protein n=1 Tax=Hyella patelloides LEGE 07179 TaxID=945734 RepID=A0A563VPW2_9CYAN|nr:hypothetical protein [Hyella patelloides]VEP13317.1 hypothetical protein H1P_1940003 [Hyella patelloides LEGE 07179]
MKKYNAVDNMYQLRRLLAHAKQPSKYIKDKKIKDKKESNVIEFSNSRKEQDKAA